MAADANTFGKKNGPDFFCDLIFIGGIIGQECLHLTNLRLQLRILQTVLLQFGGNQLRAVKIEPGPVFPFT